MPLIALCAGDGIGPEVTAEAVKVLKVVDAKYKIGFEFVEAPAGGGAYDKFGTPLPPESLEKAKKADAVFLGAVGGPKWEGLDYSVRPERGLLGLRSGLDLFANIRPAKMFAPLVGASTLKREYVEGIDIIVIRELTGDIYFGKPRGVEKYEGGKRGVNTMVYTTPEIERIARVAFEIARKRSKKVCSVDKANVLECTELWREVVTQTHEDYQDVQLSHMYVDNAAMQLVRNPKQFDVMLTPNLFGDILSDEASMLTGSIGMLPSASLNGKKGMYEPIHGSAPDIAGKGIANPIASILSMGMMLELTFGNSKAAREIENAVGRVLEKGFRTADIYSEGTAKVTTTQMGELIIKELA
ncbi:MAG: 3-isopropylmalate dehydrogenase [Nitrospinae bacterium]|nr:3-isopropylmalate dehydrogenase [Nitrospinota bacterium]